MNSPERMVSRAATRLMVVLVLALALVPQTARADTYNSVFYPAPNWALGSPQFARITGCSDLDVAPAGACVGGISDIIRLINVSNPAQGTTSIGLNEVDESPGGGNLGNFFPFHGGMADIIIPNAHWLFPRWWAWRDAPTPNPEFFFSDYVVLFNWFNGAHFLISSNFSDAAGAPPDLNDMFPGAQSQLPGSPTDISGQIDSNGEFSIDLSNNDGTQQGDVPEPGMAVLVVSGIAGLALLRRRKRSR